MEYSLFENKSDCVKYFPNNSPRSLKTLANEHLGFTGYDSEVLQSREAGSLLDLDIDILAKYGADDSNNTYDLYMYLSILSKLDNYRNKFLKLHKYFFDPAIRSLCIMEHNGIHVDVQHIRSLKHERTSPIMQRLTAIAEIYSKNKTVKAINAQLATRAAGGMQPVFSTPWVFDLGKAIHREALFCGTGKTKDGKKIKYKKSLKLEPILGPKGDPSFGKTFQETYAEEELVALFAERQKLDTLLTRYITDVYERTLPDNSELYPDCADARVRASFSLHVTNTGRTSCTNPNIQNLPNPKDDAPMTAQNAAKAVKAVFSATKNNFIIEADYATSEVRWWALVSHDKNLCAVFNRAAEAIEAYRKNPTPALKLRAKLEGDVHRMTASDMFGVKPEDVKDGMRQATKGIVFGLIYGRGPASIGSQIGIDDKAEVEALMEQFFNPYPDAKAWLYDMENHAMENLWVESPIFRRRHLEFLVTDDNGVIAGAKRQARNAPIQGISSDAALLGTMFLDKHIFKYKKPWTTVDFVHDAIYSEILGHTSLEDNFDAVLDYVTTAETAMTSKVMAYITKHFKFQFDCPLAVDFKIGTSLGDTKKWDFTDSNLRDILTNMKRVN